MITIENGKYYELGPRTYWLMLLEWSGATVVLLLLALSFQLTKMLIVLPFVTVAFLNLFIKVALALAVLAELFAFFMTWLQYGVCRIMLDTVSLRIVRGLVSKHEMALPFRRIQSVEIQQNPIQRIFGIGHMVISTTTDVDASNEKENSSEQEIISMMDYDLAEAVASALTNHAEIERMRVEK